MEVVSNLKINDPPAILMAHLCLFLGELRNKSHQEKTHHPIVMIHTYSYITTIGTPLHQ